MQRLSFVLACCVIFGAHVFAQEIVGKTTSGSFGLPAAILKLSAEVSTPSANNTLFAGERGTIKIMVSNAGGSPAERVSVTIIASAALQGLSVQPMLDVGSVAKGGAANATAEVVVDKAAKAQKGVLTLQAISASGVKSELCLVNLIVKEMAAPPVIVARDLTPPVIEITEPVKTSLSLTRAAAGKPQLATSASSVTIKGFARDSSGVAIVTINGDELKFTSSDRGAEFSTTVLLAMGLNEIEIRALDRFKNESKMSFIVQREDQMILGAYYALVIAVQDYQDPNVNSLQYPVQDAENLVNTLTTYYNFDRTNVILLKNPNRTTVIKTFDNLAKKLTEEDNVLVFYAGHGYWDERLKQGYWLPVDASQNTRTEWISNSTIRDYVAGMATKHTLLISDACFSGGLFKTRDAFSKLTTATRELYRLPSRKAMTSGALKEVPDKSVFVEYLIKRLKENKDSLLPAETLFASFRQAVINNSPNNQVPQYGEIRETGDEGGDFIFVKR